MKILVLADQRSKALYDYYEPAKLEGVELVISCGDLDPGYLSFFATLCHAPLLYVRGNHDGVYADQPPEGCICIEDDIYVHNGVRIMGLGGSKMRIPLYTKIWSSIQVHPSGGYFAYFVSWLPCTYNTGAVDRVTRKER